MRQIREKSHILLLTHAVERLLFYVSHPSPLEGRKDISMQSNYTTSRVWVIPGPGCSKEG